MTMLGNYLKITFRNLKRRRAYAIINIVGLAVGTAACLVIGKYVEFESSYETFNVNAKNIYRVVSSFYTDGPKDEFNGYDLGPAIQRNFPEVKAFTRLHGNESIISYTSPSGKQVRFNEPRINVVDSNFFSIFTFKFIYGNPTGALAKPFSVVITKTIAKKYFGWQTNPVGKIMNLSDGWIPGLYEVSAVIEDVPDNSHFNFDFLVPMHNLLQSVFYHNQNARWDNFKTYLVTYDKSNKSQMELKIPQFVKTYRGDDKAINLNSVLQFQNLLDIHYSPNLQKQGTHRTTIYLFAIIAAFVLVIAWVNYVNLSTARAMERAREVGVKKAIGVSRKQLIFQFVFESVLVNLVSTVLAIGLAILLLPVLNDISGRLFEFDFTDPKLLVVLVIIFASGSIAAGIYPAIFLSSFKTTEVIKGRVVNTGQGLSLRNGLIGFQFISSLLLLVGTFVIYEQVSFMQSREKGFDTDRILIVKGPGLSREGGLGERMLSFKNELLRSTVVNRAATSFSVPGSEAIMSTGIRKLGLPLDRNRIGNMYWVDPDFIDLYNIPLIAGKMWNPHSKSEMQSAIINEEAVKVFQLGTNETALGEKLILPFDTLEILGVVKNHHWNSMKKPYSPMIFRPEKISPRNISVQIKGLTREAILQIKEKYETYFPGNDFSYYFLKDFYQSQYQTEQQVGKLLSMFSILAVVIGCLGLWGLASFTTLHRLKEIGIRKVLGASVKSILLLLSKQFLKPLLIGSLIVLPLAWVGAKNWLDQFPYRIQFTFDLYLIPLLILTVIALATISFQTFRAATTNPVNSLKNE